MNQLLTRYFEEKFFIIPIRKDDKRPVYKKWNQYPLSYNEAKQYLKNGYNIGVVSGEQSRKDDYDLIILDFDSRPSALSSFPEFYRSFNTWVQFTPHGYHIFLRLENGLIRMGTLTRLQHYMYDHNIQNPHRTTINPHHEDNTFTISREEHDEYFLDTVRWSSMYAIISPSKVEGKSYWWLDDCEGEILRL